MQPPYSNGEGGGGGGHGCIFRWLVALTPLDSDSHSGGFKAASIHQLSLPMRGQSLTPPSFVLVLLGHLDLYTGAEEQSGVRSRHCSTDEDLGAALDCKAQASRVWNPLRRARPDVGRRQHRPLSTIEPQSPPIPLRRHTVTPRPSPAAICQLHTSMIGAMILGARLPFLPVLLPYWLICIMYGSTRSPLARGCQQISNFMTP
jgi:hypothetical protein